jgi:hypothetical protein
MPAAPTEDGMDCTFAFLGVPMACAWGMEWHICRNPLGLLRSMHAWGAKLRDLQNSLQLLSLSLS